jgi:hypothetical protein
MTMTAISSFITGQGEDKTQGTCTTTALCDGFQGLGGGANQQAFCKS